MEKRIRNRPEIKEKLKSTEIVIHSSEQEPIMHAVYSSLMARSSQEAKGLINKKLIAENESLRAVFLRLANSLEIADRLEPVEWLWLGFHDRITESQLEKWIREEIKNQESTEFYTNAVYLLKKKRAEKRKFDNGK